ncbi:MAG: CehA/McbA family metallohydrolase [Bacteroidia bacterium]
MKNVLLILFVLVSFDLFSQDKQPFYFQTKTLLETLKFIGSPIENKDEEEIQRLINDNEGIDKLETILDKYAILKVDINPESRVKATAGPQQPTLFENGWKTFLVKVKNEAGITAHLSIQSEQAKRTYDGGEKLYGMAGAGRGTKVTKQQIEDRWLDLSLYTQSPMSKALSGLETEYLIIQLYSRDEGKRAAKFRIDCGQATQDIGFRNEVNILFTCISSQKIKLNIKNENGVSSIASFVIKDEQGNIYPSQMKRLAPDFFFQSQIYRYDKETIELPFGNYEVTYGRGPEYLQKKITLNVTNDKEQDLKINLERWINPNLFKWYSGDHHIHAAGCSHYTSPTEGVNPSDMMRHIAGEGVNIGSVLTWGPGYYHQKQFFEGKDNQLSTKENLMRYDLEISGFPSGHAGHLVLLRLKNQHYPNTNILEDWPTYTIPILKWAKAQNAVTGYAHSGLGLEVKTNKLPNYEMPRFDGIGANEYIVAVTHNLVDFISTMDTPPTWELNIWYHTLNCGFRTRISGETDFPCMSDEKVAHGRSYVKLDRALNFDEWTEGLKIGRTYVSDGQSHILDFNVNEVEVGTKNSELKFEESTKVSITAKVSALLKAKKDFAVKSLNVAENVWEQKPFWNLERARIDTSRNVTIELVVNGAAVDKKIIVADGALQDVNFTTKIEHSSWVALRILPSSHTNPIFVMIDNKPIRANKQSVEWCLKAVDECWQQKQVGISDNEKVQAKQDYDYAREVYKKILTEVK